ncbi:hypothetical protein Dimus_039252 [Dionaea muscipula]
MIPQPQIIAVPHTPPPLPSPPTPNTAFEAAIMRQLSEMRNDSKQWYEKVDATQQQVRTNTQSIARLKTQVGQIAETLNRREEGRLPSQPIQPQKGQNSGSHGEVKAIMTLRNKKEVDTLLLKDKEIKTHVEEEPPTHVSDDES